MMNVTVFISAMLYFLCGVFGTCRIEEGVELYGGKRLGAVKRIRIAYVGMGKNMVHAYMALYGAFRWLKWKMELQWELTLYRNRKNRLRPSTY